VGQFIHHTNLESHQADARKLVCYDCGVACDLTAMRQERTEYLVQLGARHRPVEKEHPVVMTPEQRRPRASFDQGVGRRVRLSFRRVGRAAFASHLDLVRLVPRVFRRAEIPMFYSQGFHPKPDMTFGPALALGISTLDEYVDVKLSADVDCAALPARLQPGAPDGLTFVAAIPLGDRDPTLNKVIDGTRYVAAVPWSWLRAQGLDDIAAVQARVDARRAEPMVAVRKVEGIGKKVDVGALLLDVAVDAGHDAMAAAGYAGALLPVTFLTRVTPNGAAKPAEVLDGLLGVEEVPARFIRVAQGRLDEHNTLRPPLDLDAHRKPPRVREVAAEVEATAIP
jgi:radical SAM-linked protein